MALKQTQIQMNKLKFIVFLFTLLSCTIRTNKNQTKTEKSDIKKEVQIIRQDFNTENIEFASYLELIPMLELPIEKKCYDDFVNPPLDIDNPVINKFKPEGAGIYGKFSINANVIAVIYLYPADYIYPFIVTYDSNATKISDFGFFDGYCGRDYNFYSSSYCKISKTLQISRIDSTTTFDMDENDETIGIKESKVNKTEYAINQIGEIIKK